LLEKNSKYIFHEKFVKALLQRPLNLRRANIFSANYDLAFEYAFDRLGVHYIDGFAGFHKRFFKPETFDYDIFYPGSTTSGKVQRIEKVVRYFKLHGSLSWVNSEARDANNLYGIEEKPLELIESLKRKGEILIYPSAVKKSYTLDFPYSELFRQFASTITQSQSVLITIGYSFGDDHFNDIIFQALSNPTFTLIIVDFAGTKSPYIKKMQELNDPRIIILEGEFFGDFLTFADTLMPNFNNADNYEDIASTLNKLLSNNNTDSAIAASEDQNSKT
ncbi:MAG TPA: SIR2 family protein, partial [Saprospiraceae bacterium]|nr:SIR2 family protein [Saprospiraceae bacterium]